MVKNIGHPNMSLPNLYIGKFPFLILIVKATIQNKIQIRDINAIYSHPICFFPQVNRN